ncbi:hypothetical protein HOG48_05520 [Candidatus Peregrinibacteria bacterium]|jgi:hypothetical protein|nr:hypothetical protein [Candidatus Peregrinibacteria bacterium]
MHRRTEELETLADLLRPGQTESSIGPLDRDGSEMFQMIYGIDPNEPPLDGLQRVSLINQVHERDLEEATVVRPALFQAQANAMPGIHQALLRGSMMSLFGKDDLHRRGDDGRLKPRGKEFKDAYREDIQIVGLAGVVETLAYLERLDFLKFSRIAPVVAAAVLAGKSGAGKILHSGQAESLDPILGEIHVVNKLMEVLKPKAFMAAATPDQFVDKDTFLKEVFNSAGIPEERKGPIANYVTSKLLGAPAVQIPEIIDAILEAAIYTSFDWSNEKMGGMTKVCEGINAQGQFTEAIQGLLSKNDSALAAIEALMQKAARTIEGPDRFSCIGSPAKLQDGRIQVIGQDEIARVHKTSRDLVDRRSRGDWKMILGRNPIPNVVDETYVGASRDMEAAYYATATKKILRWMDNSVQQYLQGRTSVQNTSPEDLARFRAMRRKLGFQGGLTAGIMINQLIYAMRGRSKSKALYDLLFRDEESKLSTSENPWEQATDPIFANTAFVEMQKTLAMLGQILPFLRASQVLTGHLYRRATPQT